MAASDDSSRAPKQGDQTRTGAGFTELVAAVDADLLELEARLDAARKLLQALEREGRGLSGLSSACRGWRLQVRQLIENVQAERRAIPGRLTSSPPPIEEKVNHQLAERVAGVRAASGGGAPVAVSSSPDVLPVSKEGRAAAKAALRFRRANRAGDQGR